MYLTLDTQGIVSEDFVEKCVKLVKDRLEVNLMGRDESAPKVFFRAKSGPWPGPESSQSVRLGLIDSQECASPTLKGHMH